MTTVYYNFPAISLSLQGVSSPSSQEIQISSVGQPLTNIQLNNVNYSAKSLLIASSPSMSSSPGHLILKCYADINDATSNMIFIAIPLAVPHPDGTVQRPNSVVDTIINSTGGETVALTLNDYIKPGGNCVVQASTTFPLTITLDSKSAIPVQQHVDKKFYNVGSIPSLTIDSNPGTNTNAVLQLQDLDWVMSCELLTEDGPTEKTAVDPGTTATTISLFTMAIFIAGITYKFGPVLYQELGMYNFAQNNLQGNHYSINVFWGVNLVILALLCLIHALKTQETVYNFITISLLLSFASATSGVLKIPGISNADGTGFKNTESMLRVYSEIISTECYSTTGLIMKIIMVILFIYSFIALTTAIAIGNNSLFVSHLILFLFFSVALLDTVRRYNKMTIT